MAVGEPALPIDYYGKFREYSIVYSNEAYGYQLMEFCPFCGARLPPSLRIEWYDRVETLGLDPRSPGIPPSLRDDRWWREDDGPSASIIQFRPDRAGSDGQNHIHHEVTGSGPVVLMTHGFGASSHMFAATVADLATDHTAVVWDMRGHGRSESPADAAAYSVAASLTDMLTILDVVGAERAVLVGHSLGGYLSLELAIAHPHRTAALVLVDTGPGYRSDRSRDEWNEMAERYARDLDERGLDGLLGSDELIAGVHRGPAGLALSARGVLRQTDSHVLEALPSIAAPTLVVVGERDTAFLAGSRYMADKIPGAALAVIDGAGHAPPVSHPDAFNAVVRTFLGGLSDVGA